MLFETVSISVFTIWAGLMPDNSSLQEGDNLYQVRPLLKLK